MSVVIRLILVLLFTSSLLAQEGKENTWNEDKLLLLPKGATGVEVPAFVTALGFPTRQKTSAHVAWSDEGLKIKLDSQDNEVTSKARARDDGNIRKDDCVEIFFDIDHSHDEFSKWIHLVVNASGSLLDESGPVTTRDYWTRLPSAGNVDYNAAELKPKVKKTPQGWQVELLVSWKALGKKPAPGDSWGFNLCRTEPGDPNGSCWTPTHGYGYRRIQNWGHVIFTDPASAATQQLTEAARLRIAEFHKRIARSRLPTPYTWMIDLESEPAVARYLAKLGPKGTDASAQSLVMQLARPEKEWSSPVPPEVIHVTSEPVADDVGNFGHSWQAGRLLKYGGTFYAVLPAPLPEGFDAMTAPEIWALRKARLYRRSEAGQWSLHSASESITTFAALVGPDGNIWNASPDWYTSQNIFRTQKPGDFTTLKEVYAAPGSSSYGGWGISPEGNFLVLHSQDEEHIAHRPNAMVSAFYDQATGQWHKSGFLTPEGRHGYVGVVLKGKSAVVVTESALQDANRWAFGPYIFSWRSLRLAYCEDLTRGEWLVRPFLMPEYGSTMMGDMVVGPDGAIYLSFTHIGAPTYEKSNHPAAHYIARVDRDLNVEVFATGLPLGHGYHRLIIDGGGRFFVVSNRRLADGKSSDKESVWRLDPRNRFTPVKEYLLSQPVGVQTLRPASQGGEGNTGTVHFLTQHYETQPGKRQVISARFSSFDLPKDE